MACPTCGAARLRSPVPPSVRDVLSNVPDSILVCPRCLRLEPVEGPADEVDPAVHADAADGAESYPDFSTVSTALPSNPAAAVAVLLLVDRLSSLALNRRSIESLVEDLEMAGVDPLLALDRLDDDPALEPDVDLSGRRAQLAQLLE